MERLTTKSKTTEMVWFKDGDLDLEPCEMTPTMCGKAIGQLAKYEDSGLSPEEVSEFVGIRDERTLWEKDREELLNRISMLNSEKLKLSQQLDMERAARCIAESKVEDLAHTKEIMAAKLEMVYLIFRRDAK